MDISQPITTLPPEWQAQINEMFRQFSVRADAERKAAEAAFELKLENERKAAEAKREEERKIAEAERRAAEAKREEERKIAEAERQAAAAEREKERKIVEAELKKSQKAFNRSYNRIADRIGDIVSDMVEGNILRKFRKVGYNFDKCARRVSFDNKKLAIFGEIDLFLEDGEIALIIEVKTKLEIADVREHIERMEKYRRFADAKNDNRRFIAAVAGAVVEKQTVQFAQDEGMFVIVQSGDATKVIKPPEGFKAREW
jgi:flagellar biosynthesis GTPase FlhF